MTLLTVVVLPGAFVTTVVCGGSTLTGTGTETVVSLLGALTVVCDVDSTWSGTETVVDLLKALTVVCDVEDEFTFDDDDCCCTIEMDALFVVGKVITPFGKRIRSTCSEFRFITSPCSSKIILK